jgi:hypothetical protein
VFRTVDGAYNYFRGWIIDDVVIRVGTTAGPNAAASSMTPLLSTTGAEDPIPADQVVPVPRPQEP